MDEISKPTTTQKITRRQLFDELYEESKSLKKRGREKYIYDRGMPRKRIKLSRNRQGFISCASYGV